MFCENCENKLQGGAKFCEGCGAKTEPVQPANTASAEPDPMRSGPPPLVYTSPGADGTVLPAGLYAAAIHSLFQAVGKRAIAGWAAIIKATRRKGG